MSFIQSVAGPSRLPAQLVRAAPRSACSGSRRHYAAPAAKPPPKQGVDTRTVKPEFTRAGYETWLHSIGEDYKSTEPGQPARWLGGRTPYPGNPSFAPPPPLSDRTQDRIYRDLRAGGQTVTALSVKYQVSKARIEAVQQLKEIESEFLRQGLPLQKGFQNGMESLLGAISTGPNDLDRLDPQEVQERGQSASMQAELDEERRYDAGNRKGGAFVTQEVHAPGDGLERVAYEWRSEDEIKTGATAAGEPFSTPATEKLARTRAALENKAKLGVSHTLPANHPNTVFRFVDMSATGIKQDYLDRKSLKDRMKKGNARRASRQRDTTGYKRE